MQNVTFSVLLKDNPYAYNSWMKRYELLEHNFNMPITNAGNYHLAIKLPICIHGNFSPKQQVFF